MSFLNDIKKDRILHELSLNKKRENAFSKMTIFSNCFFVENIAHNLTHLEDSDALQIISNNVKEKYCYDLRHDEVLSIKDAYIRAVNSYMVNVLIVNENTIIYVGDCSYGASEKYILKKRS